MSDRRKEAEEKMAKAIFISADCWLCVFDLITLSQLGLGIAMISHRFDFYVDEHFKTRKWTLKFMLVWSKIGENGTKGMEIANSYLNLNPPLPIPQIQVPHKVIAFKHIEISFIDRNAIAFLHRFRQLFAKCPINLSLNMYYNDRILVLILCNIWPMLVKNIHGLRLSAKFLHHLRKFVPSILNDCSSLRVFNAFNDGFFTEFPADDSAVASEGQALAKWLFTPFQNNVPKLFKCMFDMDDGNWASQIETIKSAFASASSTVNFIVIIRFIPSSFVDSVVPFDLINELTREQFALKRTDNSHRFLLIRCPIARDESKWTKWEEEAIGWRLCDQWNRINIHICEDEIGDGLLDAMPGPSDQQKK